MDLQRTLREAETSGYTWPRLHQLKGLPGILQPGGEKRRRKEEKEREKGRGKERVKEKGDHHNPPLLLEMDTLQGRGRLCLDGLGRERHYIM